MNSFILLASLLTESIEFQEATRTYRTHANLIVTAINTTRFLIDGVKLITELCTSIDVQ